MKRNRLVALSLLVAASMPVAVFSSLWPLVSRMPVWDQWSMVEVFDAHYSGRPVWPLLLKNYQGHWNCIPRAVIYWLGLLTHWDMRVEVFLNYGAAVLTQILLLRMLYEARPGLLILAAPVSAYVYSLGQYVNFTFGYTANQLFAQLAATATIYLLTRSPGRRDFLQAMTWAVVALFCNSVAIAIAPVGLLVNLALAPRSRWRWLGWGLVVVLAVLLGVTGAAPRYHTTLWARLVPFALAALGHPFMWRPYPALATAQFLGGAAVVGFVLLLASRWRSAPRPFLARWAGLGLFSCVVALLVALGRSYSGVAQALASQYVTHTSGLSLAILVLAADPLEQRLHGPAGGRTRWLSAGLLALLVGGVMLQTATVSQEWLRLNRGWTRIWVSLNPRLAEGAVTDAEIHGVYHPNARLVRWGVERLRQHGLAWFNHREAADGGRGRVELAGRSAVTEEAHFRVGAPWSFEGFAFWLPNDGVPFARVELVVNGIVVATSTERRPRPDVAANVDHRLPRDVGWRLDFPAGALLPAGTYQVRVVSRNRGDETAVIGELRAIVQ